MNTDRWGLFVQGVLTKSGRQVWGSVIDPDVLQAHREIFNRIWPEQTRTITKAPMPTSAKLFPALARQEYTLPFYQEHLFLESDSNFGDGGRILSREVLCDQSPREPL